MIISLAYAKRLIKSGKYIITHDGDILEKDLTAAEAVIYAARYDGWGAEFCRDETGGMALRRSPRHVGNNAWMATGEEPALFGLNSALEDDDAAIEDCVQCLIVVIENLHSLMRIQTADEYMAEQLAADE